jgi:hypothetical protein
MPLCSLVGVLRHTPTFFVTRITMKCYGCEKENTFGHTYFYCSEECFLKHSKFGHSSGTNFALIKFLTTLIRLKIC